MIFYPDTALNARLAIRRILGRLLTLLAGLGARRLGTGGDPEPQGGGLSVSVGAVARLPRSFATRQATAMPPLRPGSTRSKIA
jgi:hypothetical protein